MAINKVTRAALKALSYPDIALEKTYKVERRMRNLNSKIFSAPADYKIWDQEVMHDGFRIPVRIFLPPHRKNPRQVLLFFHGGGWVFGNIDTYSRVCIDMAAKTSAVVVSVDYRLAPEHRFPTAVEDCYAVAKKLFTKSHFGVDPDYITLIGDSAGGNLAAALSLMARDRGEFLPRRQILIYPALNNDYGESSPFPSVREKGEDFLLTSKRVGEHMSMYLSCPEDLKNPYFAPLCSSDFSNQPKTLIITAEHCLLRDEGEYYGRLLHAAGGYVKIHRIKDALHGFFALPPGYSQVRRAYQLIHSFLYEVDPN